jgi:glycosyltransferase involved in cell wall biosynthesis
MKDKISSIDAIVTFYNEKEEAIIATIEALLKQEWGFSKIFLIDDGSTNQITKEKFSSFTSVILLRNEVNKGISFSRNLAIELSKSVFIACINVEILIEPTWTKELIEVLKENPEIGSVYSHLRPQKKMLLTSWRFHFHEQRYEIPSGVVSFAPGHAVLFRRADLLAVGGYNPYYRKVEEDYYISNQLKKKGFEIWYYNAPLSISIQKDTLLHISKKHMTRIAGNYFGVLTGITYFKIATRDFLFRIGRNTVKLRLHFIPLDIIIYLLGFYYYMKNKHLYFNFNK